MSGCIFHNHVNDKKNLPEQLKRSEDHNKIKGLHIEGKSDQTQEGKDCHREVKPGHMVRGVHGSKMHNNQSFDTESKLLLTDSNQSWNKPSAPDLKSSTTPLHHKLEGRRQGAPAEFMHYTAEIGMREKHDKKDPHLSEKQCNSREQFWTQKIHLQEDTEDRSVAQNIFLQHLCLKTAQDHTVERVCLQEDPHPIDGHHRICNRWRKTFISTSPKTAVTASTLTRTHGILEGLRLHKQVDS